MLEASDWLAEIEATPERIGEDAGLFRVFHITVRSLIAELHNEGARLDRWCDVRGFGSGAASAC